MNNKFIIIGVLSSCLLMGCGGNKPGPVDPVITDVIQGKEDHYITTGLHDIDVKDSDVVFVTRPNQMGASSEYTIVYDTSSTGFKEKALKAAQFISNAVHESTAVTLEIEAYNGTQKYDKDAHYIFIGCRDCFDDAGLIMPRKDGKFVDLGSSGYYIKTTGNSCFVEVERVSGFQMAAICFAKYVVGLDYYTEDFSTYFDMNVASICLPSMTITELPDFESRNYVNNGSSARLYALGYTPAAELFIPVGGVGMHNCQQWLPFDTFGLEHRGWYQDTRSAAGYQLCYTAHGDQEELDKMVDECYKVLEDASSKYANVDNITLTQLDAPSCCDCDTCKEVIAKDGSISATIIRFMNALDTKYREKHPDSKLNLLFFAYQNSLAAPSTDPSVDPSLKCHDHVFPIIAPINAIYTRSFYDDINEQYANNFTSWSKFCNKFCAWVYECNYRHYMYPYNSYQPMVDTYKFLKQYNTAIMYNEGQRYNTAVTCFGRFKDYIDSKLNVNVNVTFDDLKKTFFGNYYGPAGQIMETLFNEETAWVEYVEQTYLPDPGGIYETIDGSEDYWPKPLLEHYIDLCEKAYEEIAPLKSTNPALYKVFHDHINIESMFPRFALCDLYAYLYNPDEIFVIMNEFKNDCALLGFQEYCEVHTGYPAGEQGWMSEKFVEWGIN